MSTPMIKQYEEIKAKHKDAILLFRLGDFYEMFGDDAVKASQILDITLTARNKGDGKMPMCGVPFHAIENYIAKLTRKGCKVAICDQVSDPKLPGIVKREVTRVITPGTTFNDSVLDRKTNNYLASITKGEAGFGFAYADITTGDFFVTEISNEAELINEMTKIYPAECITSEENDTFTMLKDSFEHTSFFAYENFKDSEEAIKDQYKVHSLNGFGLENRKAAVQAAGFLLLYLIETQKNDLKHLRQIKYYSTKEYMPLDEATLRNLELLTTLRDQEKEGSLLSVLDETLTSMGGRMLRKWLLKPLLNESKIQNRLDAVDELLGNSGLLDNLREILKDILDIERIISRLSLGTGNARDLIALKNTINKIPEIKKVLESASCELLKVKFDDLASLAELIEKSIEQEPPIILRDGGMIKQGHNQELDELKKISREGKTFIKDLQEKEIKRTGISSMKVKYNKVFGYYIEVSKANTHLVPEDYIRKQTLVNAERYITPELKEYEEKVLGAEEKIVELEYELFQKVRIETVEHIGAIQKNAQIFACLDVLCSFAYIAKLNNYCKPEINEDSTIEIKAGRHPVVEKMTFSGDFIPNDIIVDNDSNRLLLITGPNMGGKSTILRQVALTVLMSHIGCFVPADKAKIGLVDRIFTRVGASDNLIKGQSTFMVEMQEAANILNNATERSLIILDEIGRGTSTYDGVSIAWAITEYIHNTIKAKTLFASHYHELIEVVQSLPHAKNLSVAVKEKDDGVIFLYKLQEGGIDRSYGIEVARLAGLPNEIIKKSIGILKDLERTVKEPKVKIDEDQMDMFGEPRIPQNLNKIKEELNQIDINGLTPLQALQKLDELKKNSN
ncbi:DNA mismatch repair protein MutS [Patescibacteria group bacterium]